MDNLISLAAFGIFVFMWGAFAVGIVASQGSLDATWEWIRGLPLLIQAVVWLLFLPVVVGLWVWESAWPLCGACRDRWWAGRCDPVRIRAALAARRSWLTHVRAGAPRISADRCDHGSETDLDYSDENGNAPGR